ncbi:E3 ubiquitin-protein ligase makorin-1 [Hondaea fermentalgiana]|uniref:E3 ubiquitin-protein ligase makorin-1 n=1 Tax=Hondaea fermentalgiana TaxID=2315210 RepID=A0A2R5GUW3_9STRA|nr:E3 ubiquitin-protein ligase makorin-1 [Hondaea fermentalgiana]|eukprot:GBG34640.1 E3 ubiquitin-protein ligase makorin-1 [Hondaea fermentalgiana]
MSAAKTGRKLPCQFFVMGTCQHAKDQDCRFSHDRELCKPGALEEPCKHFQAKGFCRNGRFCLNVHDRDAVERMQQEQRDRASQGKAKPAQPKIHVHSEIKPPVGAGEDKAHGTTGANSAASAPPHAPDATAPTQAEYHAALQGREDEMYFYGSLPTGTQDQAPARRVVEPSPDWAELAHREAALQTQQPSGFVHDAKSKAPCKFFMRGECRFGERCRYTHPGADGNGGYAMSPAPHQQSAPMSAESAMDQFERQASRELECGICLEVIASNKDGRFGILTGCDHAFCLSCIKNWRSTEVSKGDDRKELVRRCPLCREPSYFVVPCDRMVRDPARKNALIEEYQVRMKKIPCRYFDQGNGTCPFGTSCFYKHVYSNGQEENPGDLRTYKDAEGRTKVDNTSRLSEYFDSALSMGGRPR